MKHKNHSINTVNAGKDPALRTKSENLIFSQLVVDARCHDSWPHMKWNSIANCQVFTLPPLLSHFKKFKLSTNTTAVKSGKYVITILVDESSERFCTNMPSDFTKYYEETDSTKYRSMSAYNKSLNINPADTEFMSVFKELFEEYSASCVKISMFHWTGRHWYKHRFMPAVASEYAYMPMLTAPVDMSRNPLPINPTDPNSATNYLAAIHVYRNLAINRFSAKCGTSPGYRVNDIIVEAQTGGMGQNVRQNHILLLGNAALAAAGIKFTFEALSTNQWMKYAIDLSNTVNSANFKLIRYNGDESQCESIGLFYSARMIIGVDHQSLVNFIFSRPDPLDTFYVELSTARFDQDPSPAGALAQLLGLKYKRIFFPREKNGEEQMKELASLVSELFVTSAPNTNSVALSQSEEAAQLGATTSTTLIFGLWSLLEIGLVLAGLAVVVVGGLHFWRARKEANLGLSKKSQGGDDDDVEV